MVIFFKFIIKIVVELACKLFKKKIKYTKNQLEFIKELEMVKKEIKEEKAKIAEVEEVNGNVSSTMTEAVVENSVVNPKDKAFSVVYDEKQMKWLAVEIRFDFQTGTLGGIRVLEQNPSKQIISERFHVLVGQNLL